MKWSEHLENMKDTSKERKFPNFMKWLEESGALWELLAAQSTGAKPVGRSNFYGGREGGGQGDSSCYTCGETGHFNRNCSKRDSRSDSTSNRIDLTYRKPKNLPSNCKFHCAMHKGEEGKFCISQFGLLRKVPFEERINLLKENGDCNKCFGDCPPSHCKMTRP